MKLSTAYTSSKEIIWSILQPLFEIELDKVADDLLFWSLNKNSLFQMC